MEFNLRQVFLTHPLGLPLISNKRDYGCFGSDLGDYRHDGVVGVISMNTDALEPYFGWLCG